MNPVLAVFDDFLPDHMAKRIVDTGVFMPVVNPKDQVTYQATELNIAPDIRGFIQNKMYHVMGDKPVRIDHQFATLMTLDTPQSLIHSDRLMGEYSLHVYLNPDPVVGTGTQFWHSPIFGSAFNAERLREQDLPLFNNPANWQRRTFVEARPGRALLHRSDLWHSAEPALGFGRDQFDGRLVLTTFFSRT